MKQSRWVFLGALVASVAAGTVLLRHAYQAPDPDTAEPSSLTAASPRATAPRVDTPPTSQAPAPSGLTPIAPFARLPADPPSALDSTTYAPLRADAWGRLVQDSSVADDLERLLALNDRAAAQRKFDELARGLPDAARRQAQDLFFRYQQYATALSQSFANVEQPQGAQAALQQLDTLHALRVQHLGADTAQSLFGLDEDKTRQLLELMREQENPTLTAQQKAELAQKAYANMDSKAKGDAARP